MKLFVFACLVAQFIIANSRVLSDLPEPCHRKDPNFKTCILKYFDRVFSSLPQGIREYNVPPTDPLDVPILIIDRTINEMASIKAVVKNLKIVGLSQGSINDIKVDLEKLAIEIDTTYPNIYLSGEYKATGQILNIALDSEAYCSANYSDFRNNFKINLKTIKKDGVKYFALNKFKLTSSVGDGYVKIISKNPLEQGLDDFIASTANQHAKEIMNLINPIYTEVFEDIFRSVLEQGLSQIPAEKIFPE